MLDQSDISILDEVLQKLYVGTELDDFTANTMQCRPRLVGADMSAYNELNYAERRMSAIIDNQAAQREYQGSQPEFEALMYQNPLIQHHADRPTGPVKISDFMSLREWQATGNYQTFHGAFHGKYQIAFALDIEGTTLIAFAFNRAYSDFTKRDRQILAFLRPHLTLAYRDARVFTKLSRQRRSRDGMLDAHAIGCVDLDPDMSITAADEAARSRLREFFNPAPMDDSRLPSDVQVQAERATLDTTPAPLVVKRNGKRLILRMFQQGPLTSLSLERFVMHSSPEPLIARGLSGRQTEVQYWVSQGKSNAEIAKILKISVRTAENHVYRILEALGVNNRTEAAGIAASALTGTI